jgi:hypothetical protein
MPATSTSPSSPPTTTTTTTITTTTKVTSPTSPSPKAFNTTNQLVDPGSSSTGKVQSATSNSSLASSTPVAGAHPAPPEAKGGVSIPIIAGAAAGGLLLLAILGGVAFYLNRRQQKPAAGGVSGGDPRALPPLSSSAGYMSQPMSPMMNGQVYPAPLPHAGMMATQYPGMAPQYGGQYGGHCGGYAAVYPPPASGPMSPPSRPMSPPGGGHAGSYTSYPASSAGESLNSEAHTYGSSPAQHGSHLGAGYQQAQPGTAPNPMYMQGHGGLPQYRHM